MSFNLFFLFQDLNIQSNSQIMSEPTRLDFGAGAAPQNSAMAIVGDKASMGRQVLKQVQNVDLNLTRALKAFAPGGKVERDLGLAKEDFSKVKFTYQELSAKNDFIRSVVEGIDGALKDEDAQQAEEKLAEGKVSLKKTKERCKALKDEVEAQLASACHKYQQLQQEAEDFGAFVQAGSYSDDATAATRLEELEAKIQQQHEVLKQQEESIRDLSQQKQELSIAVRGLDAEVSELSEKTHPSAEDVEDRRAAAWFDNANSVLSSLVGVTNVDVSNTAVCTQRDRTISPLDSLEQQTLNQARHSMHFHRVPHPPPLPLFFCPRPIQYEAYVKLTRPPDFLSYQVDVVFNVLPYSRDATKATHSASKVYTLTLEFEHGDERLTGAHMTPADVDVSDLIQSFITVRHPPSRCECADGALARAPSLSGCCTHVSS